MLGFRSRMSRRSLLGSGIAAARLAAQAPKNANFESEWKRYPDPTTELQVYRLTEPAYTSTLPAGYNHAIARNSGWLLFCCDRTGSPQPFRMDMKSGETRQLVEAEGLDGRSLALAPDSRSFCYFAGRSLNTVLLATLKERALYEVPEGWERSAGMSVAADGTEAVFAERRGDSSRLRAVSLGRAPAARTIAEAPFALADPIVRPGSQQVLYRQGDEALWLVGADGKQNRKLALAPGLIGPANWTAEGKTILYLSFPEDRTQLNAIREFTVDPDQDRLVAKTSQFADFNFNPDSSVFVGASRNGASPTILILLRTTRRELTLCEHKASHPETVNPMFSPDSQRIYFQSDRHGKPALYSVHVERLVEKTGDTV